MKEKKQRVLVALSGGIDSAVSAYLLIKQGYEVEAAFMKNWSSTRGLIKNDCSWLTDRQDALRVAAFLRIPLRTLDFEKHYKRTVMDYFFREYKAGRTPNPDVMCNKEIKFKLLYDWAMKRGYDYLATGHYAQIGLSRTNKDLAFSPKPYILLRSKDEFKDQTYFIYNIKAEQLPHLLFPVGGMKKSAVRALARKLKFPNAEKKESMGLCFVGKIRLKDFLEQKLKPKPGPIVRLPSHSPPSSTMSSEPNGLVRGGKRGGIIGQHQGLQYYTIGQRQGIQVGPGGPWYVVKKDLAKNVLVVTNNPKDPALFTKEVQIHSVNFINDDFRFKIEELNHKSQITNLKLQGRFRHQQGLQKLTIKLDRANGTHKTNRTYTVTFAKPQTAVASGQSLVLYQGKICLGGGVIA